MMSAKFIAFVVFSLIAGASSDEARQGGPQVYFRRAFTFLFWNPQVCFLPQRRLHVSPDGFELETDGFDNAPQTTEWPHLVGLQADEAEQAVLNDRPDATVHM
jgi:hypothetical protein